MLKPPDQSWKRSEWQRGIKHKQIPDVCLPFKILTLGLPVNLLLLQRTERQRKDKMTTADRRTAAWFHPAVSPEHNDFRVTKATDPWTHSSPLLLQEVIHGVGYVRRLHWGKARLVSAAVAASRVLTVVAYGGAEPFFIGRTRKFLHRRNSSSL